MASPSDVTPTVELPAHRTSPQARARGAMVSFSDLGYSIAAKAGPIQILDKVPFVGVGKDGFVDAYALVKDHPTFSLTHHAHQEILELLINFGHHLFIILHNFVYYCLPSGS